MNLILKNSRKTINILGTYQIVGGLAGLGIVGWLLLRMGQISGPLFLIFSTAILFYIFSISAGIKLIERKPTKFSLLFSIVNQTIQILGFSIGGFKYEYYSGLEATVGFVYDKEFKLNWGLGVSEFNFELFGSSNEFAVSINLLAIVIISQLIILYQGLENKENIY